jgi:hypothetical protein
MKGAPVCPDSLARSDDDSSSVIPRLERWELFGGVWRVASRSADRVDFSLLRCDAGEEVDRIRARRDAVLEAFLADHEAKQP